MKIYNYTHGTPEIIYQYYWRSINEVVFSNDGGVCEEYIVAIFKIKYKCHS